MAFGRLEIPDADLSAVETDQVRLGIDKPRFRVDKSSLGFA